MSIRVVGSNLVHKIPVKQADNGGGGGGGSVTVDSELSLVSENPVQNKVIAGALNDLDIFFMIEASVTDDETIQAEVYTLNKTFNEIKAAIQSGKICLVKNVDISEYGSTYSYGIVTRLNSSEYSSKVNVVNIGIAPTVQTTQGKNVAVARSLEFSASNGTSYPVFRNFYGN